LTEQVATAERLVDALRDRLADREEAYREALSDREFRLFRRHVDALDAATEYTRLQDDDELEASVAVRDRAMADAVSWVLDGTDAEPVVVWAHNGHVKRGDQRGSWGAARSMGDHLGERYDDGYYALGFDFASGTLRAGVHTADGFELATPAVDDPPADSATALLADLADPPYLLDLARASDDPRCADWLSAERRIRSVGSTYYRADDDGENYAAVTLREAFDGLLFLGETTHAEPLDEG
jgi:erythromycin esterase